MAHAQKKREDDLKMDEHQRSVLVSEIKDVVEEFNKVSSIEKIAVEDQGHRVSLQSPNAGSVNIDFFPVEPPVRIRGGQSFGYSAAVSFSNGAGFNLLLVRNGNDDLYGKWQSCLVRMNALVPTRNRIEPFCFSSRDNIGEIGAAATSMHIYTVQIQDWDVELLFTFLKELLRSKASG